MKISMSFFWKISTKFDLGFFELTKCNFRRHFGGCLVKNMELHVFRMFFDRAAATTFATSISGTGVLCLIVSVKPRFLRGVSIPLWNLFLPALFVKNTGFFLLFFLPNLPSSWVETYRRGVSLCKIKVSGVFFGQKGFR